MLNINKEKIFEGIKNKYESLNPTNYLKNQIYFLICILKAKGISIYNYSLVDKKFDFNLLGCLLSVVDQLQNILLKWNVTEVLIKNKWEIDFQNFKIYVFVGEILQFVLVLKENPSEYLKESLESFGREVESKYSTKLKYFQGDLRGFQSIEYLAKKYFG